VVQLILRQKLFLSFRSVLFAPLFHWYVAARMQHRQSIMQDISPAAATHAMRKQKLTLVTSSGVYTIILSEAK